MSSDLGHAGLKLREDLYALLLELQQTLSPKTYDACVRGVMNGLTAAEGGDKRKALPFPDNHRVWFAQKATEHRPKESLSPISALEKRIKDAVIKAKQGKEEDREKPYTSMNETIVKAMETDPRLKRYMDNILGTIPRAVESQTDMGLEQDAANDDD